MSKSRLCKNGGHAKYGADPHPKNGTGPSHYHSGSRAGQIAGTYLSCDGRCKGLEGAHSIFIRLIPLEFDVSEHRLESASEFPELHKAQSGGEPDAGSHKQYNKNFAGQNLRQ